MMDAQFGIGAIMKLRWKIAAVLAVAGAIGVFLLLGAGGEEQRRLEQTRGALRRQGFKIDLSEFNFFTSEELRARASALTNVLRSQVRGNLDDAVLRTVVEQFLPQAMQSVGSDAAVVAWTRDKWPAGPSEPGYLALTGFSSDDLWPALRESLSRDHEELDAACAAALSGPIRFELNANQGIGMLLRHLPILKNLCSTLGSRAVLALHEGNEDAAWTNLLAATRLVTAWDPEPVEVSLLARFSSVEIAYNATWQVLQADGWTDERLANLQQEWESVDFFHSLPETAAFTRASMVAEVQRERQQPKPQGVALNSIRSPSSAWYVISDKWRRSRYRAHGTYEDEIAMLLFYRDRELEFRRAVQSPTWSEMRPLPGVTNAPAFRSRYSSRTQAVLNLRQIALGLQGRGLGLMAQAAEVEARRRLIITALALERYRRRHGSYPLNLQELVPDLPKNPPTDFMDGQPLRYRLTGDGHFVLYSVGLDCVDNGGKMPLPERQRSLPGRFGIQQETDLVWPRPASAAEAQAQLEANRNDEERRIQAALAREAAQEAQEEEQRQAAVRELLATKPAPRLKEPTFQGQPLSKILRNDKAPGKTQLTLDEMLTLKQVTTGQEPDIVAFEVPISYAVVTNIGSLDLCVDADPEENSSSRGGRAQDCTRAANGDCLLTWNTTYDPPGQHALQARVACEDRKKDQEVEAKGPVLPFLSTNVLQFFPGDSMFTERGASFYAKVAGSNAAYSIELTSPTGQHIKTIMGTTTNGVIDVNRDLIDDHGNKYTNDSFESRFNVTLPDSGRSQTTKGR